MNLSESKLEKVGGDQETQQRASTAVLGTELFLRLVRLRIR